MKSLQGELTEIISGLKGSGNRKEKEDTNLIKIIAFEEQLSQEFGQPL